MLLAPVVKAAQCQNCGSLVIVQKTRTAAGQAQGSDDVAPEQPVASGSFAALPAPRPRRPRPTSEDMEDPEERHAVRRRMLALVPGFTQARSEAVLTAFPTFSELVQAEEEELGGIPLPRGGELGPELARVLKLVFG